MKNILIMIVCLSLISCAKKTYKFDYPNKDIPMFESSVLGSKSVFIKTPNDYREENNKNRKILWPLTLWENITYNKVEDIDLSVLNVYYRRDNPAGLKSFDFNLKNDLRNANIKSISRSKLFNNISNEDKAYYKLETNILEFKYKETGYYYGLGNSRFSLLHLFGLPSHTIENIVKVEFNLIEINKNKIIFNEEYEIANSKTVNLYNIGTTSVDRFEEIYQKILNQLIKDLEKRLFYIK